MDETKALVMYGAMMRSMTVGPMSLAEAIESAKRYADMGIDAKVYKLTETHYFKAVVK